MDLSSVSTEDVYVPVTAVLNGASYDPTADTVQVAFLPNRIRPSTDDWHAATWSTTGGTNYAVCLVGPENGGVVLDIGTWVVWVRVVDSPEVPVMQAGYLNIT